MAISSLALAVSMPAALVLLSLIFLDPCLVKRTQAFRQPCGSDEEAGTDQATLQPATAQGGATRRQPPGPGQPPRPGRSSRNGSNLSGSPITRAEKCPRQRTRIPPSLGRGAGRMRFACPPDGKSPTCGRDQCVPQHAGDVARGLERAPLRREAC